MSHPDKEHKLLVKALLKAKDQTLWKECFALDNQIHTKHLVEQIPLSKDFSEINAPISALLAKPPGIELIALLESILFGRDALSSTPERQMWNPSVFCFDTSLQNIYLSALIRTNNKQKFRKSASELYEYSWEAIAKSAAQQGMKEEAEFVRSLFLSMEEAPMPGHVSTESRKVFSNKKWPKKKGSFQEDFVPQAKGEWEKPRKRNPKDHDEVAKEPFDPHQQNHPSPYRKKDKQEKGKSPRKKQENPNQSQQQKKEQSQSPAYKQKESKDINDNHPKQQESGNKPDKKKEEPKQKQEQNEASAETKSNGDDRKKCNMKGCNCIDFSIGASENRCGNCYHGILHHRKPKKPAVFLENN